MIGGHGGVNEGVVRALPVVEALPVNLVVMELTQGLGEVEPTTTKCFIPLIMVHTLSLFNLIAKLVALTTLYQMVLQPLFMKNLQICGNLKC